MIKVKILNSNFDRNIPTFNPLIRVKDTLRDYSIELTDSDDFDYMFVGMSDFLDKKKTITAEYRLGFRESIKDNR